MEKDKEGVGNNPLKRLAKAVVGTKLGRAIIATSVVGTAGTGIVISSQGATAEDKTPPPVENPIQPISSRQESLNQKEVNPHAVKITYDQLSRATIAAENGHILRVIPPPLSQDRELDRDQGFEIKVFWETLAGTPKLSRPFIYVITTAAGERVDGYVRFVPQASMKQEETSPQPDSSPSVITPKSLQVIFVNDIGSIIVIGPDGRLVRAIHLPSSYSQQVTPGLNVSVWRRTAGGKIVGEPVGARLTTGDGTDITPHIGTVPQLAVAITP